MKPLWERVMRLKPGTAAQAAIWRWHDHGNEGSAPVVWLDGLDTAFANLFGAHFREDYPEDRPVAVHAKADSLLSFPFERTRANLERMSRSGEPDPAYGFRLRYSN